MERAALEPNERKAIFEDLPVPTALRKMVVPTIISQIIVLIYNMADTFFVGRTKDPFKVAGVSLILPVFNITICLAGLASIGGGTLVSRLLGEHKEDEAKRAGCFAIYLAVGLTALFSLSVGLFMTPLLKLLGAGVNTFRYAKQYVTFVLVCGGVPTVLSNVLANLLRSTGRSKEASFGIALGGVLNILLDPFLMFVILPQGKEVMGVGIATLISNCVACCFFLTVLFRTRRESVITLDPRVGLPSRSSVASIFAIGIPASVATLLFDLDYVVIDRLMSGYDDIALAAIGIVLKIERLPLNTGVGISQGMMPLVAYNFASGNHKRMDGFIRNSLKLGLLVAAGSIVLYECFAGPLTHFFIPEPETAALAASFLRVRVLATPLMFMSFFTVHLFQGFGRGGTALFLGIARWAVLNIPMLFLLDHFFEMFGIVWSQVTADTLNVLLCFAVYTSYRRRALRRRDSA